MAVMDPIWLQDLLIWACLASGDGLDRYFRVLGLFDPPETGSCPPGPALSATKLEGSARQTWADRDLRHTARSSG